MVKSLRPMARRLARAGAALGSVLLLAACLGGEASPNEPFSLTVLHVNDHHSHLDASPLTVRLPGPQGEPAASVIEAGGWPRVAGAMAELAPAGQSALRLHAGDATTGDLYYTLTQGEADARMMDAVCFDAFTLGNHEFDHGDGRLKRFLDHLAAGACPPAILSANVSFAPTSPLSPQAAPGLVQPSILLVRDGRRIGLVGLTVADKTQRSSRPDPGTRFTDEAQAAQREIDRLRAQRADVVILLSHIGYAADLELARSLRGVDAIVGGDSHTLLGEPALAALGLAPAGPYPTRVQGSDGRPVCVAQAWQHALALGELHLRFGADGRLADCDGTLHILVGDTVRQGGRELAGEPRAAALAALESVPGIRPTAPDAASASLLAPYAEARAAAGTRIVAQVPAALCGSRMPSALAGWYGLGVACPDDAHADQHGGDTQQLAAQAFLAQARDYFGAEIALVNGGSVRSGLPPGPLSVSDVHALLPFDNNLVSLDVTGGELHAALEGALEYGRQRRSAGSFPYAAGLRWRLDPAAQPGQRVRDLEFQRPDGGFEPLQPQRHYRLAVTNFLADGGDGYGALADIRGARRLDVGLPDAQVFLEFLGDPAGGLPVLSRPDSSLYSTQAVLAP